MTALSGSGVFSRNCDIVTLLTADNCCVLGGGRNRGAEDFFFLSESS